MSPPTKDCPFCGELILASAVKCRHCRAYLDPMLRPDQPTAADRMLVPVGRSGSAIAAGYLGLFALFPFIGVVAGGLAIWLGCRALGAMRRDPSLHGAGRAWFGILVGGVGGVAWAVFDVLFLVNRK